MPFKAGQSGNPGGRPKSNKVLTQHLIAALNEIDGETKATRARMIVNALIDRAIGGDVAAAKEAFDRIEGKVPQAIAGDPENPITHIHEIVRKIVRPKD